jgi:hypothetical protein
MSDLERDLRAVAEAIEFPPTPDLAPRIRQELRARPRSAWPRRLALAVAVAAVGLGAAFAVPPARTAILRFLGIGAVRIEFVDRLPAVHRTRLTLGTRINPDAAPFPLLRSSLLGNADAAYYQRDVVTLLFGTPTKIRLLVSEIRDSGFNSSIGKKLGGGTRVLFPPVRGATGPAVWLEGEPHAIRFPGGPVRLAANTLIWVQGDLTLRLEGALKLGDAVRIANSFR